MKKARKVILSLIIIILLLIGLLVLLISGKIALNKDNDSNDINYQELAKISKMDYNYVIADYSGNNSANVLSDGRVMINFLEYIPDINNAKDLAIFSGPGTGEVLYILTNDGYIYKYEFDNNKTIKIDKYNNIVKLIHYRTRKGNAGGCDYIVLVDKNGKYYTLDSYCV